MESSMKKAVVERRSRLLYLSMRRREKIRKAIMDKQMEIQRHIRHRMYILKKMKRLAHTFQPPPSSPSTPSSPLRPSPTRHYSPAEPKSDWWERVVTTEFQPQDWLNTFHLSKDTFDQLCDKLRPEGVVNGHGQFWDVRVGFPGSTDDATILQGSELWMLAREGGLSPKTLHKLMGQPLGYVLLGDAAFPLQSWLLKCYPESPQLTPQQHTFNTQLSHARTPIEGTFRRLKARWQCLKRNNSNAALIPVMTQACCILHNMCEMNNDPFMEKWLEETSQSLSQPCDLAPACLDDSNGEAVRSLLCDYLHQLPESQKQGSTHTDRADSRPVTLSECAEAVNILTTLD
ncbi:hypothetical protein J4Q44_G00155330 [Coregonus suidteri]|uniref:DDE Tnp4 domain-containing protein n=1 Tax=Coregonus suidteri TaxID=861788 RepID=A0AAN8QRX0_9TELE